MPDAGIVMFTAAAGHEFALVRLNTPERLRQRAIEAIVSGAAASEVQMPIAGELSAYCPLSGEDRFAQARSAAQDAERKRKEREERRKRKKKSKKDGRPQDEDARPAEDNADGKKPDRDAGQYFIDESSAYLLPLEGRPKYKSLRLQEMKIHTFKRVDGNALFFQRDGGALKVKEPDRSKPRGKPVSTIIFIRHGSLRDQDPRTLTNIYGSRPKAWLPLTLTLPTNKGAPKEVIDLLADWETLYAERAVPFPAMREVADAFPSRDRVQNQLVNHREKIKDILDQEQYWIAEGDRILQRIDDLEAARDAKLAGEKNRYKQDAIKKEFNPRIKAEKAKFNDLRGEYNLCKDPQLANDLLELISLQRHVKALDKLIRELPTLWRAVIVCDLEGGDLKALARRANLSDGALRAVRHRAIVRLRERLSTFLDST